MYYKVETESFGRDAASTLRIQAITFSLIRYMTLQARSYIPTITDNQTVVFSVERAQGSAR